MTEADPHEPCSGPTVASDSHPLSDEPDHPVIVHARYESARQTLAEARCDSLREFLG